MPVPTTVQANFLERDMDMKCSKKLFGLAALVLLAAVMAAAYFSFREAPIQGGKHIVIQVVDDNGAITPYELDTDSAYLQQAMDEAEGLTYGAEDGPYGLSVHTVNGLRADYEKDKAYWGFYVNDDYCNYGISQQPVEDGDVFRVEYTPA